MHKKPISLLVSVCSLPLLLRRAPPSANMTLHFQFASHLQPSASFASLPTESKMMILEPTPLTVLLPKVTPFLLRCPCLLG